MTDADPDRFAGLDRAAYALWWTGVCLWSGIVIGDLLLEPFAFPVRDFAALGGTFCLWPLTESASAALERCRDRKIEEIRARAGRGGR